MKIEKLPMCGAAVIEAEPFMDHRGVFARFFCEKELSEIIGNRHFVNVNFSRTLKKGAIRGLHFQYPPKAEMKLVRCIRGSVYDVIVDIRKDSPTFLKWFSIELSADNMKMLCVPEGFAHGFQVLEESSEMLYLHSEFYSKEHEGALNYSDPLLAITWPVESADVSERDKNHKMIYDDFRGVIL
ncbi:dTDP-4-dehydrorhamnose 3,5-epimerase [Methanosarcina sp. 1.H.A.2.2]|uniref:dTDP-4-dehydrorhamnose 3,5-epimerase n=1 Tax=Methanosarcina sp. 1.H.A.2.2 TaxID=1483601 RepID=UPI000621BEF9|nr:dTDP-4-dehydrorhamnose 3,5-epimerase [Methanosarcina sp. 1.H.A.2.2]KKH47426.1 dTDP-4-dehydrorhamnose 3,5-epimerase [Methanosarcina sp. 1.H.A.2.2]